MSDRTSSGKVRIVAIAGSMREGSFNRSLLRLAAAAAERAGAEADIVELRALALPLYDGDLEAASGLPAGAVELRTRIAAAQGLLLATPEYNFSIPGTFKNAIDWASRGADQPFKGRVAALMGASPGGFGAVRAVGHLRLVMTTLGVLALPGQVLVSKAHEAFDETGAFKDAKLAGQLDKLVAELVNTALKLG